MASNDATDREEIALSTSELDDVLNSAEIRSESGDTNESDLEKYGVWIKVEPETLEAGAESVEAFELSDLGGAGGVESKLTAEEEKLLGELESEAAGTESADFEGLEKDLEELGQAAAPAEEDEELTVADLDLDLDELAGEKAGGVESLEELPEMSLESKEGEIEVPLSASSDVEEPVAEVERPRSEEILRKIEMDLRQIKLEIQNLKKELAGIGRPSAAGMEVPQAPAAAPGFFVEEEDDSIALTGDELDNILNTADITEERAGSPGAALEEDLTLLELEPAAPAAEEAPAEAIVPEMELIEPGTLTPEAEEVEIELGKEPEIDLEAVEEAEPLPEEGAELEPLVEEISAPAPVDEIAPSEPGEELVLEELTEAPEELSLEELSKTEEVPLELSEEVSLEMPEEGTEPLIEDFEALEAEPGVEEPVPAAPSSSRVEESKTGVLPEDLREDVKSVLSYLDQLLEALPEDKIRQFAQSEYFGVYQRLFKELGLEA